MRRLSPLFPVDPRTDNLSVVGSTTLMSFQTIPIVGIVDEIIAPPGEDFHDRERGLQRCLF